MSILAVAFVVISSVVAVLIPWIGVLTYYAFTVMQMQYLWPYDFGDSPVQVVFTAATLLGLAGATALKMVDWYRLVTPLNLIMMLLVVLVNASRSLGSFELYVDPIADPTVAGFVLDQSYMASVFNKTLFYYFMACLLIDTRAKLLWTIYAFAAMLLFYAWWANMAYFTGEFWRFGDNGRLGGPLFSNYRDENYFAMLFVLSTPILYYIGVARSHWFFRYAVWSLIPITWHALFLTSSRGGFLSLAVVCVYIFVRSFDRKASVGMAVALILAVVFQSGHLLTRVDTTIEASELLEDEQKLDPRLISWGIATEIMRDYPTFGVGLGNFYHAFPDYSDTQQHVVHNTYLQFSANCGVLAGLIYLWFFLRRLPTLKGSPPIPGVKGFPRGFKRDYLDDLLNSMLLGFFMVSIFLDLMIYEIFYFIMLMSYCKYCLDRTPEPKVRTLKESIYRYTQQRGTGKATT